MEVGTKLWLLGISMRCITPLNPLMQHNTYMIPFALFVSVHCSICYYLIIVDTIIVYCYKYY